MLIFERLTAASGCLSAATPIAGKDAIDDANVQAHTSFLIESTGHLPEPSPVLDDEFCYSRGALTFRATEVPPKRLSIPKRSAATAKPLRSSADDPNQEWTPHP